MRPDRLVLDTNIVSYIMKAHSLAIRYEKHLQGRLQTVAFITIGELYFGAEKARWSVDKLKALERLLRRFYVIPYDDRIARCYGRLVAERQKHGSPISPNDAWIAACAVRHEMPLVTHNPRHFEDISGLVIVTES